MTPNPSSQQKVYNTHKRKETQHRRNHQAPHARKRNRRQCNRPNRRHRSRPTSRHAPCYTIPLHIHLHQRRPVLEVQVEERVSIALAATRLEARPWLSDGDFGYSPARCASGVG